MQYGKIGSGEVTHLCLELIRVSRIVGQQENRRVDLPRMLSYGKRRTRTNQTPPTIRLVR